MAGMGLNGYWCRCHMSYLKYLEILILHKFICLYNKFRCRIMCVCFERWGLTLCMLYLYVLTCNSLQVPKICNLEKNRNASETPSHVDQHARVGPRVVATQGKRISQVAHQSDSASNKLIEHPLDLQQSCLHENQSCQHGHNTLASVVNS